jgi:hypothetical protein
MFRQVVLFFVLFGGITFQLESISYANPLIKFGDLKQNAEKLQKNIITDELTLSTIARPDSCPIAGPTFREIADKMAAISSSLADSKCYEKHSAIIREINRTTKTQADATFEFLPGENGAFIENDSQTNITITNNQYQSLQNNTSLISGLFELAKDKECVESLRSSGSLTTVAQTLSRFGTMGLVLPSSVGMIGSSAILAAAGSLYVLDKLIRPKFSWKYPKDRGDFMALTCSFYNLRTQLHEGGFFDVGSKNYPELLSKLERHINQTETLLKQNDQLYLEWIQSRHKELRHYLAASFPDPKAEGKIKLFLDLDHAIAFLKSSQAQGRTHLERFAVRNFFLRHFGEYRSRIADSGCPLEVSDKVLKALHDFLDLTEAQLLAFTARQWMARVSSFENYFEDIIKNDLRQFSEAEGEFKKLFHFDPHLPNEKVSQQVFQDYGELRNKLSRIQRDLLIKKSNLERQKTQKGLSSFDEGAQSEYDIHREFKVIKDLLLGKKGWKFVRFLIEDANQAIEKYKKDYQAWNRMKDLPGYQQWACRDITEMLNQWGTANQAIELAYGFLAANSDMWTSFHPHFETFLKFPYMRSYYRELYKAVISTELAKAYLNMPDGPAKKRQLHRIKKASSTFFVKTGKTIIKTGHINLGATMVQVKEEKNTVDILSAFQQKNCVARPEF